MKLRTLAFMISAAALAGCGETTTDPVAEDPEFAKGGSSGGQSGFAVVLSEWEGAIAGPVGGVVAEVTNDGRLYVETEGGGKGKNASPGQELCVDLSQVSLVVDQGALDVFEQQVALDGSSMEDVCTVVTMHTRNHINEGRMSGQEVDAIEHSGGKIVLKDFATGSDSWEWRLIWDAPSNGADPEATDIGQGVCIDHPDDATWHVYNDDDVAGDLSTSCTARGIAVDNVAELWRVYREKTKPPTWVWVHVADFVVPFRFTVTRQ